MIGVKRLGEKTGWISKVGEDEFGDKIMDSGRSEAGFARDHCSFRHCPTWNEEGHLLYNETDPKRLAAKILSCGPSVCVVKLSAEGADLRGLRKSDMSLV